MKARPDEELGDLAQELLQFDFEVVYRPGESNFEADCLSRNPVSEPLDSADSEPALPSVNLITLEEIITSQKEITPLPEDERRSDVIFRNIKGRRKIVLDKETGRRLIPLVHERFGHVGPKQMSLILAKNFYFNGMTAYIRDHCRKCHVCKCNKTRRSRPSGKLGHLGPASSPFQIMSLDTIGGFGGTRSAKRYLHLMVDHFSRYAYILTTKGQSAKEMISLVRSVNEQNPIETLLTDQYGGLSSQEFEEYCGNSGICHIFIAVDAAFSNGLNERLNQTLINRMRCRTNDGSGRTSAWSTIASECTNEYNDTPHSVTSFPPSYLLKGCSRRLIPDILSDPPDLEADRRLAFENSLKYHNYNKLQYDARKSDVMFAIGDYVYIANGNKLNRNKMDQVRIGPFPITRKICDTVFEVCVGQGPFPNRLYHVSKILM